MGMHKGASFDLSGFDDLMKELTEFAEKASSGKILDSIEIGAKEIVNDALKLPKPISQIKSPGHTHLINTFAFQRNKGEIEVGWGKYYGPIVERGANSKRHSQKAQPHFVPLYNQNQEKYLRIIREDFYK